MFLKFDIDSCKDCYSCLRHCPVKAIDFTNNKAEIIENQCILCGECVHVCPQNAKKVYSDVDNVKKLIKENDKVALIVAPSFISNFNVENFLFFADSCKKLGFKYVEEVALGAKYVTKEYKRLLDEGKYKVLISSCCPASNDFLRMCYPNAIKYLAPVITPMIATARILKQKYNEELKIVFVGPCIAKKKEALNYPEVEYALTFEELQTMFDEKNIIFEQKESNNHETNLARFYPINRGIIKSFGDTLPANYDSLSIDGDNELRQTLANIEELDHVFIEMNMCEGGCINGPCKISNYSPIKANAVLRSYVKKNIDKSHDEDNYNIDLNCKFDPIVTNKKIPTEEEIRKILERIFKFKKEDEINCGACGYPTCREKAIAVFNGTADPEFCMPYLKNKAESISNEIIEHTPNGIICVNQEGYILDINSRAVEYLNVENDVVGKYYQDVFDLPELLVALDEEKNINSVIVYEDKKNMYFDVSITYVKDQKMAFAIYKDVTLETLNDEKMKTLRQEMISVTDEVINQQMAAVQEIASLLGESTAKAKIALINFKNTLKEDK